MSTTTLLTRKDVLASTRLHESADAPLAPGQVRVRIASFALTSNNITYAAFGESMNYWQFFPTPEDGWGVIPVWGFGTVVQSQHPGVAAGERLYGYFPMADHAVLQPDRLRAESFMDATPHRAELAPIYNLYVRCSVDPIYSADTEDIQALLRPLFTTSWLIDDFLAEGEFFGADTVMLSSASSKTAYGTAFQLAQRPGLQVIGLTSAGNKTFCESLGCYTRVVAYEDLEQIAPDTPCAYVDFAGNANLRREIHMRFANLRYDAVIGGTHVDQRGGGAKNLPGPRATFFFAPAQGMKRTKEWGLAVFQEKLRHAWHAFIAKVADPTTPWLVAVQHHGPQAAQAAYAEVLSGRGDPRTGHILSLIRPSTS